MQEIREESCTELLSALLSSTYRNIKSPYILFGYTRRAIRRHKLWINRLEKWVDKPNFWIGSAADNFEIDEEVIKRYFIDEIKRFKNESWIH